MLTVLSSSIVLIGGEAGGASRELLQTGHELTHATTGVSGVSGVQMWRMQPVGESTREGGSGAEADEVVADEENDEEAFMYSGSQL